MGGEEWCELTACNRLMEVARAAPEGACIALKAEPDDAVLLASHADEPLEAADVEMTRARGKRTAEGEPQPGTVPAAKQQKVVWRIFECGHRCARTTRVAL